MKTVLCAILVGLAASPAGAGLDPATDSFGVYFDVDGNTNCATGVANDQVAAHLLLMNPAGPTNGFECTVAMSGASHFLLSTVIHHAHGGPCLVDTTEGAYAIGIATDYPVPPSGAVLLVTWIILLREPTELLFHIGPHPIPSLPGGLPVVTGGGILRLGAVASGDVNLPVAGINAGNCPLSGEVTTFGGVKSLFR
jgi:hypothetical protein